MTSTVVEAATARRRDVFAAISGAGDREGALEALSRLLDVDRAGAEEVLSTPLEAFVGRPTAGEDESASDFELHPFRDEAEHSDLYARRAEDPTSEPAGTWDAQKVETERTAGLRRMDEEQAMWFVAVDATRRAPVGLVFGEVAENGGDVDLAIWVAPEERKKGFGMNALRESRRALASYFPGAHVVVRAPLAGK